MTDAKWTDADRINWLERVLFERKWDGTLGRPCCWQMAGPYRHTLQEMRGESFREAIDRAAKLRCSGDGCPGCDYCRADGDGPPERTADSTTATADHAGAVTDGG